MSYCSIEDVRAMNSIVFDSIAVSDSVATDSILTAETLINANLGGRYIVPFSGTIPAIIQVVCRKLAAVDLLGKCIANRGSDDDLKQAKTWKAEAMEILGGLQTGKLSLGNSYLIASNSNPPVITSARQTTPAFDKWTPEDHRFYIRREVIDYNERTQYK